MKKLLFTLMFLISLNSFSQDYSINVSADSRNDYNLNGIDSRGDISGLDINLVFDTGSEIIFNVNSPGHPFAIKSQPGTGKKILLKKFKTTTFQRELLNGLQLVLEHIIINVLSIKICMEK